jgi:phage terminase small subunit
MKLTAKQELFITEYMKDLNATQAAIRAGYSEKTAKQVAAENLSKPYLKEIIDKRLAERAKNNGITAEYVLQGIKSIADDIEAKHNDKLKAFELLGKHLKLFTDKVESDNKNDTTIKVKLEGELGEWAK